MDIENQKIGKYVLKTVHRVGGTATVYRGYDELLDRDVAIKVIRIEAFPEDLRAELLERFFKEAKVLAKLNHPNIIDVIEYGIYEEKPFIVMPFIEDQSLLNAMGSKPLVWYEALKIIQPIVKALAYAQSEGIIHRDLKPSNILVDPKGNPILIDFGVAKVLEESVAGKHTRTGIGIGTPDYTAPEQWVGRAVKASDQYSLGSVLYQLITGTLPFTTESPTSTYLEMINKPAPLPSITIPGLPYAAEVLILTMLRKDPKDRFANFDVVDEKIVGLLEEQRMGGKTTPQILEVIENTAGFRNLSRIFRENKLNFVLGVLALLVLLAFGYWRLNQPIPEVAQVMVEDATATATLEPTLPPTETSTPAPTPQPVVLFEDDFEDGNLDGWFIESGTWHIENGELIGAYTCDNCDGQHKIFVDIPDLGNFELNFDMKRLSGWDTGSTLIRYAGENFFQYDLHPSISYGGAIILSKSPTYGVAANREVNVQPLEWYHLRIRAVDGQHRYDLMQDGEVIYTLKYDDLENPYLQGYAGFMIWSGADADASMAIDNVSITSIP